MLRRPAWASAGPRLRCLAIAAMAVELASCVDADARRASPGARRRSGRGRAGTRPSTGSALPRVPRRRGPCFGPIQRGGHGLRRLQGERCRRRRPGAGRGHHGRRAGAADEFGRQLLHLGRTIGSRPTRSRCRSRSAPRAIEMLTHVGREGSCAACHQSQVGPASPGPVYVATDMSELVGDGGGP